MTSSGVFDETGPLPTGTALLEASAGTGKTYTITTLVLRLIVEADLDIDQVVVVTFTRAAAAELRGRIRGRIHDAVNLLEQQQAGMTVAFADDDAVVAHLAQHRGLEPALERLRRARERFDEATIDT
ncbi:MAG: UvrD-helicase domain-containing protein, partial [Nitriliruptoraceae bacterium]